MGTRIGPEGSRRAMLRSWFPLLLPLLFIGCTDEGGSPHTPPRPELPALPPTPAFDADSAYAFIARQVAFGPRVPGTAAHRACGDWLVAQLEAYGAHVTEQVGTVTIYTGEQKPLRNIIASWDTANAQRLLLLAHWDTRPFADKDSKRPKDPIPGANDGASGVGVLLEIARHLSAKQHGPGVDILFTDVEDYGQPSGAMVMDERSADTWALGAQYFARNPHRPGYKARFGILLDMVGARDALFYREALSMRYAPAIVNKVWRTAEALGHGDRFIAETKYFVGTDDHVPINEKLGIPTIDIIQYDPATQAFGPYWHTHDDDMDIIDAATLHAVGRTVLEVVWKER